VKDIAVENKRMSFMRRLLGIVMVAAMSLGAAPATYAADLVMGVRPADPGVCGNERVLGKIVNRFRHQVANVPNLPQVDIVDFFGVRENRYEPQHERSPIERQYCHATVALSDGYQGYNRDVWYLIETPMGFAGIGSNVEFCVSGFDRWLVYGGRCRVLR
jgi:hypothetical protein